MSFPISNGEGSPRPHVLSIASHKGGTGRTTLAVSLAWILGQQGRRVLLVDADPTQSAALIACDGAGVCRWKNVRVHVGQPGPDALADAELVLIDSPALGERAALASLCLADDIVLTCPADTLALRTLSSAVAALRQARAEGGQARLLGLVLTMFDPAQGEQHRLHQELLRAGNPPVLGAPIPLQASLRDWPLRPGSPLPPGAARAALLEFALSVQEHREARQRTEEACHA